MRKGWIWQVHSALYGTPEKDPYNPDVLMAHYEQHNQDVIDYFAGRNDLLVINVAQPGFYAALCQFLDEKPLYQEFPWKNKS